MADRERILQLLQPVQLSVPRPLFYRKVRQKTVVLLSEHRKPYKIYRHELEFCIVFARLWFQMQ